MEIDKVHESDSHYNILFKDCYVLYRQRKRVLGSADDPLSDTEETIISLCKYILSKE